MTLRIEQAAPAESACRSSLARALRAVVAAAGIVGLGGSALALPAVQTSALTEVSRVPYQATLSATCDANFCLMDSAFIRARQQLEIHHLSCEFRVNSPNADLSVRTAIAMPDDKLQTNLGFHQVATQPWGSSGTVFTVSESVRLFVRGKRKLRILAIAGGSSLESFGCFISGELVTLERS